MVQSQYIDYLRAKIEEFKHELCLGANQNYEQFKIKLMEYALMPEDELKAIFDKYQNLLLMDLISFFLLHVDFL